MTTNYFYLNNKKIILRERKKALEKKTKYFLFNLTDKEYVSSLYHLRDNKYQFDYKKRIYFLYFEDDRLSYEEVG